MEHRHTMHTIVAVFALTLLHTAADCFAANPYIGTWKFNDAKSKMRPEVTRNSTITYAEQGDYIKVTMDGTNSGKRIRGVWVGKFDGKAYPVKGNPYHDAEGMRLIDDHTLFIQGLKDRKVMWWGNDHDLKRRQNSHCPPSLDRLPREEADRHKGL